MRNIKVKVHPSSSKLQKENQLAWKLAEIASDEAPLNEKAIDMVMRIKSKVPTKLVTLDRDLKVLTKNEVWEILE